MTRSRLTLEQIEKKIKAGIMSFLRSGTDFMRMASKLNVLPRTLKRWMIDCGISYKYASELCRHYVTIRDDGETKVKFEGGNISAKDAYKAVSKKFHYPKKERTRAQKVKQAWEQLNIAVRSYIILGKFDQLCSDANIIKDNYNRENNI
jgi:hypothetical protein